MKTTVVWALIIGCIVFFAYTPSLHLTFFMDDYLHLTLLREHRGNLGSILYNTYSTKSIPFDMLREHIPWWVDPTFQFHYFRPIPTLSLALDFLLWGEHARGYHYTCVLLHCMCALVVYVLAMRMGLRRRFAIVAALASGLHPNHIFAVSWVCNRDTLLGTVLFLLSVLAYNEYLDASHRRSTSALFLLSFLLFIAGVLSKESVVVEPAVLLVVVTIKHSSGGSRGVPHVSRSSLILGYTTLIPFVVVSTVYSAWYAASDHGVSTGYLLVSPTNSVGTNIAIVGKNLFLYLISLFYYVPPEFNARALQWPNWLIWTISFSLPAALFIWQRSAFKRIELAWVCVAWLFVFLAPAVAFIPLGRLLYTSTIAYSLLIAAIVQHLLTDMARRCWRICTWSLVIFYIIVIPFLLVMGATLFLASKGDTVHLCLERALAKVREELPEHATIFLLNVPQPASAYMASVVHRFYHQGDSTRIFALGNVPAAPVVERTGIASLRLKNQDGIIDVNVSVPLIPLSEGSYIEMPSFSVKVEKLRAKRPVEVLFTFEKPLESPTYAFIAFVDGNPTRVDVSTGYETLKQ